MKMQNLLKQLFPLTLIPLVLVSTLAVYAADEKQAQEEKALDKDKISLDLKNVDIIELLRILSLKTGKTIVPSKGISGRITIYLSNVKFDDVLDIILLTQDLALYRKGNVYYVMTAAEYKKSYGKDYIDTREVETIKLTYSKPSVIFNALGQLKSEMGKIVVDESSGTVILIDIPEKLELFKSTIAAMDQPLGTAVFNLNYVKPSDAKTQLSAAITQGTGEVIIDERSGKAIVTDLPKKIEKIGRLVRELDEDSRQVYVEADVIELTLSDEFQRGINWQEVFKYAEKAGITMTGSFPMTLANSQTIALNTTTSNNHALVNFLQSYGKTNIISQPRIAVVNNEEANLMVGERDAYITQTQSQATSTTVTSETVEFVDVGVKLKIVPRIGADGYITMKLKPEVSSVKETITTQLGSRVPIVQTSQSETVVKVKDGSMIILAGMSKLEDTDDVNGWPFLSRIPLLGIFFSNRDKELTRTEVIIFLTPHIIPSGADLAASKITEIIPKEYLPTNLKRRVTRDEALDGAAVDFQDLPKEKAQVPDAGKQFQSQNEDFQRKTIQDEILTETSTNSQESLKEKVQAKEENKQAKLKKEKAKTKSKQAKFLQEDAGDYYQKGLRAQADFNNSEAKKYFTKAIEMDDKLISAYNNLGIIYEQEGKASKAEGMYLKVVSIDPQYAPVYSNLALLNEERGNTEKAREYWRKRVSYGDPNDEWTKEAIRHLKRLEN